MAPRQRPEDLRRAVISALGINLSLEDLAILAGRLRFNDDPALPQQTVADRLECSQPHISNRERELVGRLQRAAAQRTDERSKANELHKRFDAVVTSLDELRSVLPPRRKLLKRPTSTRV